MSGSAPASNSKGTPAKQVSRPSGPAPLNPERPPQLLGKYSKLLGKDLDEIVVRYTPTGVTVTVSGHKDSDFKDLKSVSLAEYQDKRKVENLPDEGEKMKSFRNKYELRLNKEFPKDAFQKAAVKDKDGDILADQTIQAFLDTLPFKERRALLMTQKQFTASYPNGFSAA
jgi:hypothetical protein